jgi:uncharacterized membrane protein YheB (UPF0754 family)
MVSCCLGGRHAHKTADGTPVHFDRLEDGLFPPPRFLGEKDAGNEAHIPLLFCTPPLVEYQGNVRLPSGGLPEQEDGDLSEINKILSPQAVAASTQQVERWKEAALVGAGSLLVALVAMLWAKDLTDSLRRLELASIPIVAMLFTWFHIWLAIQMMFLPIKFFGLWEYANSGFGVGWQGIVPRKARKMAKTSYVCARPYLDGPRDWLVRVDPRVLVQRIRPNLKVVIEDGINRVSGKHGLHGSMVQSLGDISSTSLNIIEEECPNLWKTMIELLADKELGIDNDGMIVKVFTEKKELLNRFFMVLGEPEFRFIEHCGAVMGLISGIIQLIAFSNLGPTGRKILMPTTGFLLGIFSNWLAILMCFKPCFPRHIRLFGCDLFTVQGLFLKRQPQVCSLYSKMLCEHFLIFDKVVEYLQEQPVLWEKLVEAYVQFNTKIMRQTIGFRGWFAGSLVLGQGKLEQFEKDLQEVLVTGLQQAKDVHDIASHYIGQSTDIEAKNRDALQRMPPDKFENLLHPIFKEDEWILVLLGGVLGAIVGIAQIVILS